MRKWIGIIALLLGGALLLGWFCIRLPGEIAVLRQGSWSNDKVNAIYLLKPLRWWGGQWRRLTPQDIYALEPVAWSPDGQWVAFRCATEIIYRRTKNNCEVFRAGKGSGDCNPDVPDLPYGLCLIDRNGEGFRHLVNDGETDSPYLPDIQEATHSYGITWTLDGQYIVFRSHAGWSYLDPMSGTVGRWDSQLPVQSADYWYSDMELRIPGESFERSRVSCSTACRADGLDHVRGYVSPDERYVAFLIIGGESDPWQLAAYDTETKRILRFERARGYWQRGIAWLP